MKATQSTGPAAGKPAMQKAIVLCAAVCICAIIYLLVGSQSLSRPAMAALLTPTPVPSAAPTQPPGLRQEVVLDRLQNAGLLVEEKEGSGFSIQTKEDDRADTLKFYLQTGYVRGFTLYLPSVQTLKATKSKSLIEEKAQQAIMRQSISQDERIRNVLPILLSALTLENYFPASVSLSWAQSAIDARESGKPQQDTQEGISFSVIFDQDGGLLISADLQ